MIIAIAVLKVIIGVGFGLMLGRLCVQVADIHDAVCKKDRK